MCLLDALGTSFICSAICWLIAVITCADGGCGVRDRKDGRVGHAANAPIIAHMTITCEFLKEAVALDIYVPTRLDWGESVGTRDHCQIYDVSTHIYTKHSRDDKGIVQ